MHARTHTTCTHTFTHTCMHTHRHAHMHACTHSCSTHMRIYTHTHTHTHTHARMHTHTHTTCWRRRAAFCLLLTEASASFNIWCTGILPKLSLNPWRCKRLRLKFNVRSMHCFLQPFLMVSFCEQHNYREIHHSKNNDWSCCIIIYRVLAEWCWLQLYIKED